MTEVGEKEVSEKKVPSWVQTWAERYAIEEAIFLLKLGVIFYVAQLPKEEVNALLQELKK